MNEKHTLPEGYYNPQYHTYLHYTENDFMDCNPKSYKYILRLEEQVKELQKNVEQGEHYKHLYSEVKKQKDDTIYPSMVIRSQAEAIELLEKENQQLKNKINNLTSIGQTIFTGKNYNDLALENEKLKKQKDDVVETAKEKIKRYESYIHDLKNGKYPIPTVKQEIQELIFRIREQKDLLRMLGEIDE